MVEAVSFWSRYYHRIEIGLAILLAIGTGILILSAWGTKLGSEFFAAYLLEMSLSADNLFAFHLVFKGFHVAEEYQERVLHWGLFGAVIFRGVFLLVGVTIIEQASVILVVLACVLILSALHMLFFANDDDDEDLQSNRLYRLIKSILPVTDDFRGHYFFVRDKDDRIKATPLFLCLVLIEITDIVFAIDSVPAVLGVSDSFMVLWLSNIEAIFALRAMYYLVREGVAEFRFLDSTVSLILLFVGTKMIVSYFDVIEIASYIELGVIAGMLMMGIGLSMMFPGEPEATADSDSDVEKGESKEHGNDKEHPKEHHHAGYILHRNLSCSEEPLVHADPAQSERAPLIGNLNVSTYGNSKPEKSDV